jgi:hypothetical protein
MAEETQQFMFGYQEVVAALIKKQGLHEGIWQLAIQFGIGASNIQNPNGEVAPAAIVPVVKIGLQRVSELSPLAVDAAKENPKA